MQNHFFIPYIGNKRQEVEVIYEFLEQDIATREIETVVEPYCGTSAFSYYFWTKNKDKNINYILNDNNEYLIRLYTIAKDEKELTNLVQELNELQKYANTKEKYNEIKRDSGSNFLYWLYINKIYNINPGIFEEKKENHFNTFFKAPILEFLRTAKITFTQQEGLKTYIEYKGNEKTMIFLDPPYSGLNNDFYLNPAFAIYEHLYEKKIEEETALITLCLENNIVTRILFKNMKQKIYEKIYQVTKKKTQHTIIINKIS